MTLLLLFRSHHSNAPILRGLHVFDANTASSKTPPFDASGAVPLTPAFAANRAVAKTPTFDASRVSNT